MDPDKQVQESFTFLFATFDRTGSATATMKAFRKNELLFPRRVRKGPQKGELIWEALNHQRVLQVVHNPRYAGAFVWGRRKGHRLPNGHTAGNFLAPDEWISLVPGAHAGYITWQQYQANQLRLLENAKAHGDDRRQKSTARRARPATRSPVVRPLRRSDECALLHASRRTKGADVSMRSRSHASRCAHLPEPSWNEPRRGDRHVAGRDGHPPRFGGGAHSPGRDSVPSGGSKSPAGDAGRASAIRGRPCTAARLQMPKTRPAALIAADVLRGIAGTAA